MDLYGNKSIPIQYVKAEEFCNGVANVALLNPNKQHNDMEADTFFFVINTKGETVFQQAKNINEEGLRAVLKNGKWGFIGKEAKEIVACKYESVSNFSDGLVCVAEHNMGCGTAFQFLDSDGNIVIDGSSYGMFHYNVAKIDPSENDEYYYINKKGELLFDGKGWICCSDFFRDFCIVKNPTDDQFYVMNRKGELIYKNADLENFIDNPMGAFTSEGVIEYEELEKMELNAI
jgi:hypothetical protein